MINYLTPEQVLFIHSRVIEATGGSHGMRDLGMLLSALGRPQASFEANDFYHDIFAKAASLLDSLVRNHPFIDGNKRTAITSTAMFLMINGYALRAKDEEFVRFTLACAQARLSLEEIEEWLKLHSQLDKNR